MKEGRIGFKKGTVAREVLIFSIGERYPKLTDCKSLGLKEYQNIKAFDRLPVLFGCIREAEVKDILTLSYQQQSQKRLITT
jgi:hypothetical protein